MVIDQLFAQYKPGPGETYDLYLVSPGDSAKGTLWIAARNGYDQISVQLMPAAGVPDDKVTYILYNTPLHGNVPIYLQDIYLGDGDGIRITSTTGDCSFTFTGEKYTS